MPPHTIFLPLSSPPTRPQPLFLAYRFCVFAFFAAWTIVNPTSYDAREFYFIFLTHWSAMMESAYFLVALITAVAGPALIAAAAREPPFEAPCSCGVAAGDTAPKPRVPTPLGVRWARHWFRFHRVLYAMACCIPFGVFLLYWSLVYSFGVFAPSSALATASTIHMHGVNFLLMLIDVAGEHTRVHCLSSPIPPPSRGR